ncbi:RNA polymerase subunit sigma-70 [Streptomyces sp. AC495_CC817]|uniref:RNA polymerase subunit sigma-70 n=1 Tax=Streptomyces sp. AC495_CC817 TaxID=2823900 RepID=UPI001C25571A|nr:RNA polymerase subunit sigma-70 [Streptomyces sp. AC495_CC817]
MTAPDALHPRGPASDAAFADLVRPFERELRAHCYRMLGSLHDAEDALQETLISAWRALPQFEGRSSLRTWLYRIATSRCLNAIRDGARRPPPSPVAPFEAPAPNGDERVTWCDPYPEAAVDPGTAAAERETLEYAFVCALQALPPRQTAALVLCDVLDFSPRECAEIIGSSPTAVKGLLQRARAAMPARGERAPEVAETELAGRLAAAYGADDVDAVIALLSDRAWLAMPPAPHRYEGVAAVAEFLRASAEGRGGRYAVSAAGRAGGHPVFRCVLDGRDRGLLMVIADPSGTAVQGIVRFLR